MIGIISYLPDDEKLKAIRKKNIKKQAEWLTSIFPKEDIHVVSQNYSAEDFLDYKNFVYIDYEKGIGSTHARNVLLDKFQDSDDEWLLLMDDDVLSYPYYDADSFLVDTYYGKSNDYAFDILLPLMPEHTPFKELNMKNNIEQVFHFSPSPANNCPNLMLLNKKASVRRFEQNVDLLDKDAIPDDSRFIVDSVANGIRVVRADFWIKQSLDIIKSVIYSTNANNNRKEHAVLVDNLKKYVMEKYKASSLTQFNKMYSKATKFSIQRKERYELPDNLATIKKRSSKKNSKNSLF